MGNEVYDESQGKPDFYVEKLNNGYREVKVTLSTLWTYEQMV